MHQQICITYGALTSPFFLFFPPCSFIISIARRAMAHGTCAVQLRKLLQHIKLSQREAQYNSIYKALQTGNKLTIGGMLFPYDEFRLVFFSDSISL